MRRVHVITRYHVVIEESLAEVGKVTLVPFNTQRFNKGECNGLSYPEGLALSTELEDAEQATKLAAKGNAYYKALLASGKWKERGYSATLDPVTPDKKKK